MSDVEPLVPGGIADHTLCVLLKLGQVAFRLTEDALLDLGLRIRHYSVLQAIADRGAVSQTELGAYLRIDAATMVSAVDDLEQLGFAERQRDPADRRRYLVDLTNQGREGLSNAIEVLDRLEDRVLESLSADERAAVKTTLGGLNLTPSFLEAFEQSRR